MSAPPFPPAVTDAVRLRDGGCCVLCGVPAAAPWPVMEPRLFADGGLHPDNAVLLCAACAGRALRTDIAPEALRKAAGIRAARLPDHLEADQAHDRWGNPVLPNGTRLRGELFFEPAVQRALAEGHALALFADRVKAPRTYHLPWSPGRTDDDKVLASLAAWRGERVVATVKMDGENTSLYADGYLHARSIDGRNHPSRAWVKRFWAARAADLPAGWRVCGENLFARHSIGYDALPSFFLGFGLWDERNICRPWDETLEWFALLGVTPVPTLYDGPFDEAALRALRVPDGQEGFVVRAAGAIPYARFRTLVGKFVRANHVQTDQHWMDGPVVPNGLAAEAAP